MSISVNASVGKSSMSFVMMPPTISPHVTTLGLLIACTDSVVAYEAPEAAVADEATTVAATTAAAAFAGIVVMLDPPPTGGAFTRGTGGAGGSPTLITWSACGTELSLGAPVCSLVTSMALAPCWGPPSDGH